MGDDQSAAPDLEALMQAYQAGDRQAADTLIGYTSPALYRFFAAQTGDRRHADDLLQDAWLRIHKARHTYRPGEPVLPWLYAIARHVRIDAFRRRRSDIYEQPLTPGVESSAASPETRSNVPDFEMLLRQLPESQREVILMLKVSGLSLEETARATSSSVGSVKQKAHRAYEKLRSLLGKPTENRKVEAL